MWLPPMPELLLLPKPERPSRSESTLFYVSDCLAFDACRLALDPPYWLDCCCGDQQWSTGFHSRYDRHQCCGHNRYCGCYQDQSRLCLLSVKGSNFGNRIRLSPRIDSVGKVAVVWSSVGRVRVVIGVGIASISRRRVAAVATIVIADGAGAITIRIDSGIMLAKRRGITGHTGRRRTLDQPC